MAAAESAASCKAAIVREKELHRTTSPNFQVYGNGQEVPVSNHQLEPAVNIEVLKAANPNHKMKVVWRLSEA